MTCTYHENFLSGWPLKALSDTSQFSPIHATIDTAVAFTPWRVGSLSAKDTLTHRWHGRGIEWATIRPHANKPVSLKEQFAIFENPLHIKDKAGLLSGWAEPSQSGRENIRLEAFFLNDLLHWFSYIQLAQVILVEGRSPIRPNWTSVFAACTTSAGSLKIALPICVMLCCSAQSGQFTGGRKEA